MPDSVPSRSTVLLFALSAALGSAACSAAPGPDEPAESSEMQSGGLTAVLPVGTKLRTTGDLNHRAGPSTSETILGVITAGSTVTLKTSAPSNGFYQVDHDGTLGWSSGKYLEQVDGSTATPLAGGEVWKFKATTLSMDVGVFVPEAASTADQVDVLVYAHGHNVCSPVATKPPVSFITGAPFNLGEIVAAAQRPIVLVVPFLDWEHLSANGMAFSGKKHKLGIPKNLNGVVAEVLAEVGEHRGGAAPGIASLILAGHSRAYDFLNPLAAAHADPQMSTGALAKLARIWAFDTTYACSPISNWTAWMDDKPSLEIDMWYRAFTDTASCGQQFDALEASSGDQLVVNKASESHCAVPAKRLPPLLAALP